MRGYNKVILMGNVTRDPEIKVIQGSGAKSARFSLAVNREWKDKATGAKKADVDYLTCQAWGPLADMIEKWVKKGQGLIVDGRIHAYKYTDKNGVDKYATDIIVESLNMVGGRDSNGNGGGYPQGQNNSYQQQSGGSNAGAGAPPMDFEPDFPLDFNSYGNGNDNAYGGGGKSDVPF